MKEIEPDLPKKPHPVYKHIWASPDGRIFSTYRGRKYYRRPVSEIGKGQKDNGRRTICLKASGRRQETTVARIVWECFKGPLPGYREIDHIDNDPTNTRLGNLRSATQAEVTRNSGMRKNNASGFKGVSLNRRNGRYQAKIVNDRKQIHLGWYESARDAAIAYDEAAVRLHGEFARTNSMLELV